MPVEKPSRTHGSAESDVSSTLAGHINDSSPSYDVTASPPPFCEVEASLIHKYKFMGSGHGLQLEHPLWKQIAFSGVQKDSQYSTLQYDSIVLYVKYCRPWIVLYLLAHTGDGGVLFCQSCAQRVPYRPASCLLYGAWGLCLWLSGWHCQWSESSNCHQWSSPVSPVVWSHCSPEPYPQWGPLGLVWIWKPSHLQMAIFQL